jgi:hypothetical protein
MSVENNLLELGDGRLVTSERLVWGLAAMVFLFGFVSVVLHKAKSHPPEFK